MSYSTGVIGGFSLFFPQVAAEVPEVIIPAVTLTRHEWGCIQAMIRELATLQERLSTRANLSETFVQGQLLVEAARYATELRHLAPAEGEDE